MSEDKEITLKKTIIEELIKQNLIIKEYTKDFSHNEQFYRGYILGCSHTANIEIPSHWYNEIIKEVKNRS